jgi:hypothetical protein
MEMLQNAICQRNPINAEKLKVPATLMAAQKLIASFFNTN